MLDFKFYSLMSGSKGNALIVKTSNTTIMIDCGGSKKALLAACAKINLCIQDIDACFITHQHSDHIQQIKTFSHVPIYSCQPISEVSTLSIKPHERIIVNECVVSAFALSHDIPTVGYIIQTRYCKIVCVTDTGYLKEVDIAMLHNADFYYMESNYEPTLLMQSQRPHIVKMRTLSDSGHLSNQDSARYVKAMIGPKTQQVMLAHLSEESNTHALATATHTTMWHSDYKHIQLQCAKQFEVTIGGNYD